MSDKRIIELIEELTAELRRQNELTVQVASVTHSAMVKSMADMINGGIGGRIGLGFETPSYAGAPVQADHFAAVKVSRPATWRDRVTEYRRLRAAGFGRISSFDTALALVQVPADATT
jgi:hypothetical protein